MQYTYRTRGTCSSSITLDLEDGIVRNVRFTGGCNGNTQAVARLVEGLPFDEVIKRCGGIKCGLRPTSCPDQLSKAVAEAVKKAQELKAQESN